MSEDTAYTSGRRTITAFFDHQQDANEAIARLVEAGIARSKITLIEGASSAERTATVTREDQDVGFWEALKDFFWPDEDRAIYAEGLRRGGYIVTVEADSAHYERAIDILDDEGTVNLDERAESWRREGWTGSQFTERSSAGAAGSMGRGAGAPSSMTGTSRTAQAEAGREEVIPVTEEQLRVGKRDVSHGRVRVRSYVVDTPVQEQVNLREEHVDVERRPVDRPATGNEKLFQERVIEGEEKAEEAVVSKDARIKEELAVKKDVEQHTEPISDTVRRTEVEVEDERGDAVRSGERKPR
jgi:uncharacterized protein (TIGR02271 family)